MANNPSVMRFMGRDSGVLVLIKLIQMSGAGSAIVSPTRYRRQVRRLADPCAALLEDAAEHGDVNLSGRGGRLVELRPSLLSAFDRFLADAMSGHDLLYKLARERMAKAQRSALSGKLD